MKLYEVYEIVTKGTETTVTEVRRDPDGTPRIVRKTTFIYNGETYKLAANKPNADKHSWTLDLIKV